MHAVQRLFHYRKSISTKPFRARGYNVERCDDCRIALKFCICQYKPTCHSKAAFLLLMWDDEVLKPSNTGRLIADLINDTHAFIWRRTEIDETLLALINNPDYQPYVVFPAAYAHEEQTVVHHVNNIAAPAKQPLFILLDGSWREAKKMFRKSPYLSQFPVLSINLDTQSERYRLRKATGDDRLATAEVAAHVLRSFGEEENGNLLDLWFDTFNQRYQEGASARHDRSLDALATLVENTSKLKTTT
ncbi:tRNA-uridine aminocarboxypropyltransferase [Psychrobium sp. nBUS_13]|uniref:tRNA-uridine aminocarboxypropyltransferase n=1 Tax=Psychrobium sp. nBUS_13 TaxID=3395319 RepID=UPI003EB7569F